MQYKHKFISITILFIKQLTSFYISKTKSEVIKYSSSKNKKIVL